MNRREFIRTTSGLLVPAALMSACSDFLPPLNGYAYTGVAEREMKVIDAMRHLEPRTQWSPSVGGNLVTELGGTRPESRDWGWRIDVGGQRFVGTADQHIIPAGAEWGAFLHYEPV